jgi:subtilisin family serine protease
LASEETSGSRRLVVALLGTGVDYTHEDLAANIFINRSEYKGLNPNSNTPADGKDDDGNGYIDDFIGYDFVDNDGLPFDRNGSGTAMAGVVAAVRGNGKGISGIASSISLMPVRFIDASGYMSIPNFFKALNYALKMKADVILLHTPSHEFGASGADDNEKKLMSDLEKQMLKKILTDIEKAGIPIVASAGNTGSSIASANSLAKELFKSKNVIAVTAVDKDDVRPFVASYGRESVHTSAPGKNVLTTLPGNRYGDASGTSVAAAHVAGALALAYNQQFGKRELRELLEAFLKPEASDRVESLQFETIGGNRLNLTKYLNFIDQ